MKHKMIQTHTRSFISNAHYPPYQQEWDIRREGVDAVKDRLQRSGSRKTYSTYAWHVLMGETEQANAVMDELLVVISSIVFQSRRRLWDALAAPGVKIVPGAARSRKELEAKAREVENLRSQACSRLWDFLPGIMSEAGVVFDEITAQALVWEMRCHARDEWLQSAMQQNTQMKSSR